LKRRSLLREACKSIKLDSDVRHPGRVGDQSEKKKAY